MGGGDGRAGAWELGSGGGGVGREAEQGTVRAPAAGEGSVGWHGSEESFGCFQG